MKKFITSLMVLAAAITASAQNFTVTGVDDATYTDGDVINVGYTTSNSGRFKWDPELILHIAKAGTLKVTAEANVANIVQFCGIDGSCAMLTAEAKEKSKWFAADNIDALGIDIVSRREVIAEPVEVKITITDGTETMNLTVNFLTVSAEEAGIDAPAAPAAGLRVSHRSLSYAVDAPTQLAIYNISGRAVVNRRISGTGSLNLAALPAGVYVYRLGSATGKFLLR